MFSSLCLYPSDLSDHEWEILAPLIPPAKPGGRPRKWAMRKILNAIFYLLRKRLPVAHAPARVPALVYRAPLLQGVAHRRHLGEGQRDLARKDAHKRRSRSPTERRDPRYPIGEDYQRWGRTRI